MQATKRINEKPSKLTNLGTEVMGASRHHFDTYDNPEKRAERERAKAQKNNRKDIKQDAINALNESNYTEVLCSYEMKLACEKVKTYDGSTSGTNDAIKELRLHVLSLRDGNREAFNEAVKAYNKCSRACSRIRWNIRSLEAAQKYLAPKSKDSFKEFNGIERPWSLDGAEFNQDCIKKLEESTRAIQFGNSLTLAEREYCLQNLLRAIEILNHRYTFNFKDLAFSFGARGKAGSIAHYQDSHKVLAFNRGWSGAFIHELGHAVDYSLGKVSGKMPYEIRVAYYEKINKIPNLGRSERHYYTDEKEIFARLFEVYMRAMVPDMTEFMQVTFSESVMPELSHEALTWMNEVMSKLTKAGV